MLDIKFIRNNPEEARQNQIRRNEEPSKIDEILKLDEKRREFEAQVSELNALKNKLSPEIGKMIKAGEDPSEIKEKVQNANKKLKEIEPQQSEIEKNLHDLMAFLPNLTHKDSPLGGEEKNKIVKEWGEKREFNFSPKDHKQLGIELDILDEERGVKVAGSGFITLKGKGAQLERALLNYFLDKHVAENGFREVMVPIMVNSDSLYGTSQLPKFKDQVYFANEDDKYLIPTAEVPITNLHRGEMLQENDLPTSYAGYTPCFRREAGSYGTGVKGFLRVHQFNKVEMVKFVKPEDSEKALDEIVGYATKFLEELNIPYRILDLATADLGFGAHRCFDIEVWSPAENKYLEASSCSNFLDFQSRRMNIRFKRKSGGKPEFVHTLNGSGLATSRLLVSLYENNQNEDGSINIPEVLRKYTGFDKIELN
jgi:seryl-tRNA synthetase